MTLIEFLKSKTSQDTPIGNLANDVINDKDFPYERPEIGIISYLEFQTRRHNNGDIFEELMAAYHEQKDKSLDPMSLDVNYKPLRAEQWSFLKAHFPSDRAIIVGEPGDIYRVYGIDSVGQKAIKFDIYTTRQLNNLSIVDLNNIYIGDLTREVPVQEAIYSLAKNKNEGSRIPTEPNYSEMLSYFRSQV
ncbi:MAG: hypothetical protein EOP45_11690 [Sphingobacteriaceae bacterium]|nr:MAG: hypothetical protein EOP45_11690 [Sphingobacteriaceae bacterium]